MIFIALLLLIIIALIFIIACIFLLYRFGGEDITNLVKEELENRELLELENTEYNYGHNIKHHE